MKARYMHTIGFVLECNSWFVCRRLTIGRSRADPWQLMAMMVGRTGDAASYPQSVCMQVVLLYALSTLQYS